MNDNHYFAGLNNGIDNHDDLNANHTGKVDTSTRNKIQKIIDDHENDPQFEYYNSDAESEGSHNSREFYGNGDVGVVSPGPGWSKDYGNKNFGISGKNLAQSNLQKHKSLSTPLFDLTKLDTIETNVDLDENDAYAIQNEAYDSDHDEDEPGRFQFYLYCVRFRSLYAVVVANFRMGYWLVEFFKDILDINIQYLQQVTVFVFINPREL